MRDDELPSSRGSRESALPGVRQADDDHDRPCAGSPIPPSHEPNEDDEARPTPPSYGTPWIVADIVAFVAGFALTILSSIMIFHD
jgi:hypothetical protein